MARFDNIPASLALTAGQSVRRNAANTAYEAYSVPTLSTDATFASPLDTTVSSSLAVKTYVDAIASGLHLKQTVRAATTANITLSGAQAIDGVSVIAGDRVLVKDQSTGADNGIYVAASGSWSRASDANSSAEVKAGMYCFVSEGTANGNKAFALTTNDPITLGSTALVFAQYSGVSVDYATEVTYGTTKLTFAPASAGIPISVGANDPTWRGLIKVRHLEADAYTAAGLASALAAMGSSTPGQLHINDNLALSSSFNQTNVGGTNYSNIQLIFNAGGRVTVSGSSTVYLSNVEEHGDRQVFFGVDANNHIRFTARAVRAMRLAWYVGTTSSSSINCTYAMQDMVYSANTSSGGAILIPTGAWYMDDVLLCNNLDVIGNGQGVYGTDGTILAKYTNSSGTVLKVEENFRNVRVANLTISSRTFTNTKCLLVRGTPGNSGFGLEVDRVTFYGDGSVANTCPPQFSIENVTSTGWEAARVFVTNCHFITTDHSDSFKCTAFNSLVTFITCVFAGGRGTSNCINAANMYALTVTGCYFGGWNDGVYDPAASTDRAMNTTVSGTSATATSGNFTRNDIGQRFGPLVSGSPRYITGLHSNNTGAYLSAGGSNWTNTSTNIYRWGNNSNRANCAIRTTDIGSMSINGNTEEGFNYFLVNDNNLLDAPINLSHNYVQDKVQFSGSCIVTSVGNHYNSLGFGDTSGSGTHIHSFGDSVKKYTTEGVTLLEPKLWGPNHAGGGMFKSFLGYIEGGTEQYLGFWTEVLQEQAEGTALERPLFAVGIQYYDTSTDGQKLFQLHTRNEYTRAIEYGWNVRRNPTSGYAVWQGLQSQPQYKAWTFAFPVGYDHTTRVNVTQTTNRTTSVTLNDCYHGTITLNNSVSLAPGDLKIFQINSNLIQTCDWPEVSLASGSTTDMIEIERIEVGGGYCRVRVRNISYTTADTGALKVLYRFWKGGGLSGVAY